MKLIGLVAAGVMLASAGAAQADDWRIVGATADTVSGIDREGIRIRGSSRIFWSVVVQATPGEMGELHSLFRIEMNCEEGTMRFLSTVIYGEGDIPIASSERVTPWAAIVPGSNAEMFTGPICDDEWIEGSWDDVTSFIRDVREVLNTPSQPGEA